MITFITSKVSDRHFTLTSKVKKMSKTRNANFSFFVYCYYYFFNSILFYRTTNKTRMYSFIPGRVAQSVTCLVTDAKLTADPGVASSIPYFRGD